MMNVQRFVASTAREALAKARLAYGDATLILSNRQTPQGVEVLATSEDSLGAMAGPTPSTALAKAAAPSGRAPFHQRAGEQRPVFEAPSGHDLTALAGSSVEKDAERLAMSTLSFQDYVRERMLRRRQEALKGGATTGEASRPAPVSAPTTTARSASARPHSRAPGEAAGAAPDAAQAAALQAASQHALLGELNAMRDLIEDRFSALAFLGQAKQDPLQSNLMLKLIRAGYSPLLARSLAEQMPARLEPSQAIRWVMEVLECNLKTDTDAKALHQQGGVYALVGSTGVGKTTTAAKLAALCCKAHGAHSVGLITLDTQRLGAHEQLRGHGRALGVVAHLAHDRAALHDLLNLLASKHMVLIDTLGLSPTDERLSELGDLINLPKVNSLLVLNAGAHGDTHDAVIDRFPRLGEGRGAVLSKTDEAAKLGPALDALIRHPLTLRGVCNGQRVPQDWAQPDASALVRASMRSSGKSPGDPAMGDLGLYFSQPMGRGIALQLNGGVHA